MWVEPFLAGLHRWRRRLVSYCVLQLCAGPAHCLLHCLNVFMGIQDLCQIVCLAESSHFPLDHPVDALDTQRCCVSSCKD